MGNDHKRKERDILAKEQPIVLESSAADPIFPAMQEFEVDEGGPKGSTKRHPGLPWLIVALIAIIVLVVVLVMSGEWF